MASQAYFESGGEGDWYACISNTAAGESPTTAPTKWSKLEIPAIFEDAVAQWAFAFLLETDGQSDKARAQRALAQEAVDELAFNWLDRGDYHFSQVGTR